MNWFIIFIIASVIYTCCVFMIGCCYGQMRALREDDPE